MVGGAYKLFYVVSLEMKESVCCYNTTSRLGFSGFPKVTLCIRAASSPNPALLNMEEKMINANITHSINDLLDL